MKIERWQQQLAWQNAFELRACPPEDILFSKDQSTKLKEHLASCRICQDKLETGTHFDAWNDLAKLITQDLPKPTKDHVPAVGQLWTLSKKLNGWGPNDRFYKAPMVLLLEEIEGTSYGYRVAQVYTDKMLMGQDDIWLRDDIGFAEAWNTYSVHKKDLELYWGKIETSIASQVLNISVNMQQIDQQEAITTEEYTSKQTIPENSIFYFFRNLEVEVGSYCAIQSVAILVNDYETEQERVAINSMVNNFIIELRGHLTQLSQYLGNRINGWTFPELSPQLLKGLSDSIVASDNNLFPERLLAFFGCALPSEGYSYPLGATSKEEIRFPTNLLRITTSGIEMIPVAVSIKRIYWYETDLVIEGNLSDDKIINARSVHAWWVLSNVPDCVAQEQVLHPDNQFTVVFKGLDKIVNKDDFRTKLNLLVLAYE